jgi:hypothetical protein
MPMALLVGVDLRLESGGHETTPDSKDLELVNRVAPVGVSASYLGGARRHTWFPSFESIGVVRQDRLYVENEAAVDFSEA